MIKYILLFYIFFSVDFSSQTVKYYKYVDTLCSDFFRGRGYVDNGHIKAANFYQMSIKILD